MSRFIIIEGGIGAGKTTLMNRLKRVFPNANFIGEYIEEEAGATMFNLFCNNKVTVEDFQQYILQYWKRKLAYYETGVYIIERGPLAGLAFVDQLTMKGFKDFENDVLSFMDNMNLNQFKFIECKARMGVEAYSTIINSYNGNLVLFLEASPKELLCGVRERGREGEARYSEDFLRSNQNALYNLYRTYKEDLNIEIIN